MEVDVDRWAVEEVCNEMVFVGHTSALHVDRVQGSASIVEQIVFHIVIVDLPVDVAVCVVCQVGRLVPVVPSVDA